MKIAILRKMGNLENDDRIRKETASLSKFFPGVTFKCFLILDNNTSEEGTTSYGLQYKAYHLASRTDGTSGTGLIKKSWDFYNTIKRDLKEYDIVWCSGDEPVGAFSFIVGKKLIWDLRELPLYLLNSPIKKIILKLLFARCEVLLHANQYRINYLEQEGVINNIRKHVAIRNFPSYDDYDKNYDDRYYEVKKWIGERDCVYLQGLSDDSRAAIECVSAVLETPGICAIVLGRFFDKALDVLISKYGENIIKERVCLAGNFNVMKVPQYMKLCKFSLVFYKNTTPNNYLCEANRLYQAIDAGLPVVVGLNPSMKSVVEELGVGISVDTDGREIELIKGGISSVLANYDKYKTNINHLSDEIKWDSQEPLLKSTFESVFID